MLKLPLLANLKLTILSFNGEMVLLNSFFSAILIGFGIALVAANELIGGIPTMILLLLVLIFLIDFILTTFFYLTLLLVCLLVVNYFLIFLVIHIRRGTIDGLTLRILTRVIINSTSSSQLAVFFVFDTVSNDFFMVIRLAPVDLRSVKDLLFDRRHERLLLDILLWVVLVLEHTLFVDLLANFLYLLLYLFELLLFATFHRCVHVFLLGCLRVRDKILFITFLLLFQYLFLYPFCHHFVVVGFDFVILVNLETKQNFFVLCALVLLIMIQ
jgi:hypothetical protein